MRSGRLTAGRLLRALALSGCATLLAVAISLVLDSDGGVVLRSPGELWAALTGTDIEHTILVDHRLPRIGAAVLVGAALAAAGCAFQAALRNPLAEPYTLGVSSGSALAAVIAIRLGLGDVLGSPGIGGAAVVGAALTVLLVWRLARVGRELPPATLILAGIVVAMFCGAATMLVQYTADFRQVYQMIRWMMGDLDGIAPGELTGGTIAISLGMIVLLAIARDLNALAAGSDAAASVGVDAGRTTAIAFAVSSLMVGAGIAVAGPIGFIGLVVPHAMRPVVGPDHRVLIPVSAAAGGGLLVICDTAARIAVAPDQLPVGVLTAFLGGPFFLLLLVREKGRGRMWT